LFTWKEIIDIAIQIETNGERIYRRAAQKAADPAMSEALTRMAGEEARHAEWFARLPLPDALSKTPSSLDKMARIFISEAMMDKALSLETADFSAMTGILDLVKTSVEFEEDTVLFFEMIRQFVDDDTTIALLDTIIAEEKNHIATLESWK